MNVVTIDDILKRFSETKIRILKMDIEGAEVSLFQSPAWLAYVDVFIIELHERIVGGCEKTFFDANSERFILKSDNEKYISIGRSFFDRF